MSLCVCLSTIISDICNVSSIEIQDVNKMMSSCVNRPLNCFVDLYRHLVVDNIASLFNVYVACTSQDNLKLQNDVQVRYLINI